MEIIKNIEKRKKKINQYIQLLKCWNLKTNLISRNSNDEDIHTIIKESILLGSQINLKEVADAGSGNGLLAIPIAIHWPEKKIYLVETQQRKNNFLKYLIERMELENTILHPVSLQEFLQKRKNNHISLVARGFPKISALIHCIEKKRVEELILITSPEKAKKIMSPIEKISKNYYNIPWRNNLVIVCMRHVSRET